MLAEFLSAVWHLPLFEDLCRPLSASSVLANCIHLQFDVLYKTPSQWNANCFKCHLPTFCDSFSEKEHLRDTPSECVFTPAMWGQFSVPAAFLSNQSCLFRVFVGKPQNNRWYTRQLHVVPRVFYPGLMALQLCRHEIRFFITKQGHSKHISAYFV